MLKKHDLVIFSRTRQTFITDAHLALLVIHHNLTIMSRKSDNYAGLKIKFLKFLQNFDYFLFLTGTKSVLSLFFNPTNAHETVLLIISFGLVVRYLAEGNIT